MTNEYICKQDAVDVLDRIFDNVPMELTTEILRLRRELRGLSPADVVPVVHGRWIHMQSIYGVAYCSECSYELHAQNVNFCPNCGAKMDGEE